MVKKEKVHVASASTPKRRADTSSLIREPAGKTDRLFVTIRDLALQQQKDSPQVFLSLRDAARRFEVPLSTMADVYHRLTEQGILSSVRGARTMLRGRGRRRTLEVQGVIGMPLSVNRLTALRDYRRCFLQLRDALRARGFMIAPVFFEQGEADPAAVVERVKQEKVDAALWLLPAGAARDTALRLRDAGIPFVGLSLGEIGTERARYQMRRERALQAILQDWRNEPKRERVVIVRARKESAGGVERLPQACALVQAEGFGCEFATLPERGITSFLKSLCIAGSSGVILPGPAAAVLGSLGSGSAADVFARCRVALLDGPLELLPVQTTRPAEADVVTADWAPIARRIAAEIANGRALAEEEATRFQARYHLRVPLAEQAQL